MTKTIRELLVNEIGESFAPQSSVYVATSGGVDSSALVLAVKDAGMKPIVTSFTLDDRESTDFKGAKQLASHFDLPFVPIYIPTDKETITSAIIENMNQYKVRGKANIECMYPLLYLMKSISHKGAKFFITGHGADGHFCLSKKGMIHYRHTLQKLQEFKENYFSGGQLQQRNILYKASADLGMNYVDPFWSSDIRTLFGDSSWEELNKPREKEPIRASFPEFIPLKLKKHTNLQLGDSGIAETVGEIIRQRFTPQALSPVSAYNYIWNNLESLSKGDGIWTQGTLLK
tara:strand:- start:819 stop:1682 length:864 start_codon:yes stop_codon:yes gene_type:complete